MSSAVGRLAGLAMTALRLPAREIWAMTPREVALALEALSPSRETPPDAAQLRALMARYPDRAEDPR